jgi:hypothetical protein
MAKDPFLTDEHKSGPALSIRNAHKMILGVWRPEADTEQIPLLRILSTTQPLSTLEESKYSAAHQDGNCELNYTFCLV